MTRTEPPHIRSASLISSYGYQVKHFRFGIQLPSAANGAEYRSIAKEIEALGYSTVFCPDHFDEQWSPTVALTIAAEATETLNVGSLVYDVDYRHPLVLAKELATLDLAAEGRVEFGIGAGWMETDYLTAGITYDKPGIRISRMIEAIRNNSNALVWRGFYIHWRPLSDKRGHRFPSALSTKKVPH